MSMSTVRIPVALGPGATLPGYQTAGSAGMDLRCSETVSLQPMERALVKTGLRVAIPDGFEGQVRARSGLAMRHGLALVNAPGTIDSDYRGEIQVLMINLGSEPVELQQGERIAQLVICPVVRAEMTEVSSLDETMRGEGGFGSTGRQ